MPDSTRFIRIGHLSTFYHTAMLLMAEGTLEKKMEAHVQWKLFGTGPAIVNAFEKGELDLAYVGLPPAIIGIARGVRIKCIAGGHIEGTVVCGRNSDSGFPEIDDLGAVLRQFSSLKIGVPGNGSIHDVILTDCLVRFDLNASVEVIHFPWADAIVEAMVKGEISAAIGILLLRWRLNVMQGGKSFILRRSSGLIIPVTALSCIMDFGQGGANWLKHFLLRMRMLRRL